MKKDLLKELMKIAEETEDLICAVEGINLRKPEEWEKRFSEAIESILNKHSNVIMA